MTTTGQQTRTEAAYFSHGTQYYVAARFAISNRFIEVAGQLFHDAVEFYLKGVLSRTMPHDDRKNLNHRLNDIWSHFKRAANDPDLDRFDYTIQTLDVLWDIRYPDSPPALTPRRFVLSWVEDEFPEREVGEQSYLLAPSRIEELVRAIYQVAGVDIEAIRRTLGPQALYVFDHMTPIGC